MRSLLDLDTDQLTRIERGLGALRSLPLAERLKKICLLQALEAEKQELIRCNPAIRIAARLKAA